MMLGATHNALSFNASAWLLSSLLSACALSCTLVTTKSVRKKCSTTRKVLLQCTPKLPR